MATLASLGQTFHFAKRRAKRHTTSRYIGNLNPLKQDKRFDTAGIGDRSDRPGELAQPLCADSLVLPWIGSTSPQNAHGH